MVIVASNAKRAITDSPPLKCIFEISRLYCTYILSVSHRILGIPLYPGIDLYLAIMQQVRCVPLYPAVSVRI